MISPVPFVRAQCATGGIGCTLGAPARAMAELPSETLPATEAQLWDAGVRPKPKCVIVIEVKQEPQEDDDPPPAQRDPAPARSNLSITRPHRMTSAHVVWPHGVQQEH